MIVVFKNNATRIPPAVYGQAVTYTAPSRAGMVQSLLWQPLEPLHRPTAVESMTMSSRAGDMHERVTCADYLCPTPSSSASFSQNDANKWPHSLIVLKL